MINTKIFIPRNLNYDKITIHSERWTAPSNIAIVKYWGKIGNQMPANPSLSFTLKNSYSDTELIFERKNDNLDQIEFELFFEGNKNDKFYQKISKFFENIKVYAPYLKHFKITINTSNSFPHSSGIASSASGFSAIAACLTALEKKLGSDLSDDNLIKKTSFLARLGSGSASRSVQGPLMVWGAHQCYKSSANEFAIKPNLKLHQVFEGFQDSILLVDIGQKEVSSTLGHSLMEGHPFAEARFKQANDNMIKLSTALIKGDLASFGQILESEALSLHAMMMTSTPSFILMKPNTISIINRVKEFRKEKNLDLYFTLDAGANVHLLYPKSQMTEIQMFIKSELAAFCQNSSVIYDELGEGILNTNK